MRLIYLGSGAFGLPTLEALAGVHELALVVSQPDRPAGRHRKLTPTDVADWSRRRGVPTLTPESADDPELQAAVDRVAPEAMVVIAYGHKLGPTLLADRFAMNLHASLLPRYRGAVPINWAIIRGERETGLSVITLASTMDAGLILARRATPIDPMETAGELHDRMAAMGPGLVLETLEAHARGTLRGVEQDPSEVTYAPRLTKADGSVEFDRPAEAVRHRVHGLTPWPGCAVRVGGRRLRLHRVDVAEEQGGGAEPGRYLGEGLVACSPGTVRLLEVQPPGKRLMSFAEYQRGHRFEEGVALECA